MKKKMKIKKNTIKLNKDVWVFNEGRTRVRIDFSPKQIDKLRERLGMTVESVNVIIDPSEKKKNRVQVRGMYRNGKRIHRSNPFKGKLVE